MKVTEIKESEDNGVPLNSLRPGDLFQDLSNKVFGCISDNLQVIWFTGDGLTPYVSFLDWKEQTYRVRKVSKVLLEA